MISNELRDSLAERRILMIFGEIEIDTFEYLQEWLMTLNLKSERDPIRVIIDSNGGSVDAGLWIYDLFRSSRAPIIGVVLGRCASTAVIVLQACTTRLATEHSGFFLHTATCTPWIILDKYAKSRTDVVIRSAGEKQVAMLNILVERTKTTKKEMNILIRAGDKYKAAYMASGARKLGLIDRIATVDESSYTIGY